MPMIRRKDVVRIRLEFDDGSAEEWTFPEEAHAFYRETTNTTTERNPIREEWHEHELRWVSNRLREVKKP